MVAFVAISACCACEKLNPKVRGATADEEVMGGVLETG